MTHITQGGLNQDCLLTHEIKETAISDDNDS
jgi:hypothetical protein